MDKINIKQQLLRVLEEPWEFLESQKVPNKRLRQKAISIWEDLARAEQRVTTDYTGRYPIELLQNAHDACSDANIIGCVWFHLTESALLVGNEGLPFDQPRLESIIRLGASSKEITDTKHHTIGYKGIGFTSVFEITDTPQIFSQHVSFEFNKERAAKRIKEILEVDPKRVPARAFPFTCDLESIEQDQVVIKKILDEGAVTVIRLPLRAELKHEQIIDDMEHNLVPEVLLFMPSVKQLKISTPSGESVLSHRPGKIIEEGRLHHLDVSNDIKQSWLIKEDSIPISEDLISPLRDELWQDVKRLNVVIGIPWKNNKPDPGRPRQPLHVYFPTDDELGENILVHGDFYVDSTRRHIESKGVGGKVSELVAMKAIEMVAELATQLACYGNYMLGCLASREQANGYGIKFNQLLIEKLKETPLLRSADGEIPKLASEIKRLNSGLSVNREKQFIDMLDNADEIIYPGDDRGLAKKLLDAIHCDDILEYKVSEHFNPKLSNLSYEIILIILGDYLNTHNASHFCDVAVVQDINNRWITPKQAFIPDKGTPIPPVCLDLNIVRLPKTSQARKTIQLLDVQTLTLSKALDCVIEEYLSRDKLTIDSGGSDVSPVDPQDEDVIFKYVKKIWKKQKNIFKNKSGLGSILVPVKKIQRKTVTWTAAGSCYYPKAWSNSSLLDRLYGNLSDNLFLAEDPPDKASPNSSARKFFDALGVSTVPRIIDIPTSRYLDRGRTDLFNEWYLSIAQKGDPCPDDHPMSDRYLTGEIFEHLDEVIIQENKSVNKALAELISSQKITFGKSSKIRCGNSSHRKRSGNKILGFQQWILEESSWLPVVNDIDGKEFVRPREAWCDMTKSMENLLLPHSTLDRKFLLSLGLVSAARPSFSAICVQLTRLNEKYPELEKAPSNVWKTACWLCEKLPAAVGRKKKDNENIVESIIYPALRGGKHVWSPQPLISDLPGLEKLSDVEILPEGEWSSLRRFLFIKNASEVLNFKVKKENPRPSNYFSWEQCVALVALLAKRGEDLRQAAFRIGRLKFYNADQIRLEIKSDTDLISIYRDSYLDLKLGKDGRVIGGDLYLTEQSNSENIYFELAKSIAEYAGFDDRFETIALYLTAGEPILKHYRIGKSILNEAEEALKKKWCSVDKYNEIFDFEQEPTSKQDEENQSRKTISSQPKKKEGKKTKRSGTGTTARNRQTKGNVTRTRPSISPRNKIGGPHGEKNQSVRQGHSKSRKISDIIRRTQQARVVTYVYNEKHDQKNEEARKEQQKRNQKLGEQAERIALEYELEHGNDAKRMPPGNSGYDIESIDKKTGEIKYIEVKGENFEWGIKGVGMTNTQFMFAKEKEKAYWLYIVEGVETEKPGVYRIIDPANKVKNYRFDSKWKDIAEKDKKPQKIPQTLDELTEELKDITPVPVCKKIIDKCYAEELTLPEVGFELTATDGEIIADAELAWPLDKIALIPEHNQEHIDVFKEYGWDVFSGQGKIEDFDANELFQSISSVETSG